MTSRQRRLLIAGFVLGLSTLLLPPVIVFICGGRIDLLSSSEIVFRIKLHRGVIQVKQKILGFVSDPSSVEFIEERIDINGDSFFVTLRYRELNPIGGPLEWVDTYVVVDGDAGFLSHSPGSMVQRLH